jgi:hypothetical protein
MGNNLVHFNTCAISYIVAATDFHMQKVFELYKDKEERRGRKDTMTYVVNMEIMQILLTEVNINTAGIDKL